MSVLTKLASALNRNDEVPNQQLAQEIADSGDADAIRELVENLSNRDSGIQSDCIKVLYEVGERKPALIADYVDAFVDLLNRGNNRLVWGGMTALGTIVFLRPAEIAQHLEVIMQVTQTGSAITQDWGVRVLAALAASDAALEKRIFPFLLDFLRNVHPKDVPRHAESVLVAVTPSNRADMLTLLQSRRASLKPAQAKRVDALIRKINAL